MDEIVKSRLRLWLRSERALGLPAVGPIPRLTAPASPSVVEELAEIPQPAPRVKPPPQTTRAVAKQPLPVQIIPPVMETLIVPSAVEAFAGSPLSLEQKIARLGEMNANEVRGCTRCRLCEQRTQTVFGEGDPDAQIFFIGEGPGETEDRTGRPFVGRAGELLTKMIAGMGLRRDQVYIANIVKCRPPGNREPAPDEVAACTPYLERQLEIIRPKVIVTLGRPAAQHMLQSSQAMGRLRGNWQTWRGIKLMPTFHPSYILRMDTREIKAMVWNDLKLVMAEIGLPLPKARSQD